MNNRITIWRSAVIGVMAGIAAFGLAVPSAQLVSAQSQNDPTEQYIVAAREQSFAYRYTLDVIARQYAGCFVIDEAGLGELDNQLTRAQAAIFRNRPAEAADILKAWYDAFNAYDQEKVAKPIDQCDEKWARTDGKKYTEDIDAWLKDLQQNYDLGTVAQEWSNQATGPLALRSRFLQMLDLKPHAPWGEYHDLWATLFNDLSHFFSRVEARVLASDQDQTEYQKWVKALGEYGTLLRSYLDAEKVDIYNAYKDELVGAKADYDLFSSKESILKAGEKAYADGNYAEADGKFAQFDRELVKPWAEKSKSVKAHFEQVKTLYGQELSRIKSRIDALRQLGQDVTKLSEGYTEATTAFSEAADAASRYCSDWFACSTNSGESTLDEYDGYWAATRFGHVEAYIEWLDAAATDLEKTGKTNLEVPTVDTTTDVQPSSGSNADGLPSTETPEDSKTAPADNLRVAP